MKLEQLKKLAINALEERKASDITVLDVSNMTSITDVMIIATGTSRRQVSAIAGNVAETAKHEGNPPIGVEGMEYGEWVLVDLGDVIVHVMMPQTREFYNLEKLWQMDTTSASES